MQELITEKGTVFYLYESKPYKQTIIRATDYDKQVVDSTKFIEINCKLDELLPALNNWGW